MQVNPGTWYVVTTDSSCTVTDANGKTLCTAVAGTQKPFLATTMEVTLSDTGATVTKSTFNAALALLGQPSGGGSVIVPPAGAIAVDYLESSGSQYIKTGYFGNQDTGLRSVHQAVVASNSRVALTRDPNNKETTALGVFSRNTSTTFAYEKVYSVNQNTTGWNNVQTGQVNYLNARRAGTMLEGDDFRLLGSSVQGVNWSAEFMCPCELYLFGFNDGGTFSSAYAFKGKIFEFQISQGEAIVRDYRPYVSRDGEPFLWDAKTGGILKNAGTGAFRIGLSTVEQVRAVFNSLPNLSGEATPGELLIRLDESIATDEVRSMMDTICNSKNWGYVEA